MQSRNSFLSNVPPIVFNLLIINTLMLGATWLLDTKFGFDLNKILGLHFIKSELFKPWQIISYMFMHGGLTHLFFNMFGVYMFGTVLEYVWSGKKFLIFYLISGIGAAIIQQIVWYFEFNSIMQHLDYATLDYIKNEGLSVLEQGKNYTDNFAGKLNILLHIPTVGASGALFGVLFAFGFMFPKEKLMLIFVPIPIPARIFVILYAVAELFLGVANFRFDNVAHFAHLGGALFGLIMIFWWRHKGKLFNHRI
ncbi:MAG: rhomboid family intramembrane serine protease [Prevotellaceae bacterium]|jgi:membrane associated rhomboid family serine protease|nr:rhomboid family intramembrane serine protease [Prevotellaceae bacterium]